MATTDIYTRMTLDEFVKDVQKHYFYRVYSLIIRTEPSGMEPHTVIPYKVTVKTLGSDVFVMYGNEPYLDMKEFVHMFQGIPLITVSSDDFENDETTKQVETCASYINIDPRTYFKLSECPELSTQLKSSYGVEPAMHCDDAMLSVIHKGHCIMQLYHMFRNEVKNTE